MSRREEFVQRFAEAIARQEGSLIPGTKGWLNNNPGNMRPWPRCKLPVKGGMIAFPTREAGWTQLKKQIRLNIARGLTCLEFFAGKPHVYSGYAPASDGNDPDTYARNVASWVGIPTNVPLKELQDQPRESAAQREEP